jgi:hypothetical protein
MTLKRELIGKKFGKWKVIEFAFKKCYKNSTQPYDFWKCRCECGCERFIKGISLIKHKSWRCRSCANSASKNSILHGLSKTDIYMVWKSMKSRCYYHKDINYKNYGARGIKVCEEWKNDPVEFYKWALTNGWNKKLQIDRKNNDGNYSPENCRFITHQENSQNSRLSKLNRKKVIAIKKLLILGYSYKYIASIFNVHSDTIGLIKRKKTWNNIGN